MVRAVEKRGLDIAEAISEAVKDSLDQLGEISRESRVDKDRATAIAALRERFDISLNVLSLLEGPKPSPESSAGGLLILPPAEESKASSDASPASGPSSGTDTGSQDSADQSEAENQPPLC